MARPLLLLLIIYTAVVTGFAQAPSPAKAVSVEEAHPKARKAYEDGVRAAHNGDAKWASKYLNSAVEREPYFADALMELAGLYYNAGDFARAEPYLERTAALAGEAGTKALYGLAMSEMKQDKYDEATGHLEAYLATGKDIRPDRLTAAQNFLADAKLRAVALANPVNLDLQRLPNTINTPEAEYLPSLTADGRTLVFTRRRGGRDEDFYMSTQDSAGNWGEARELTGVNTLENEGAQSISANGKLLVFTGCNRKDGIGSCDLYYSQLERNGWSAPRNLGAPVNTKAWESQPSLAANGELLFFASRRPGGQGKADLYASGRTPEGGFTEPINLGEAINTPGDEMAPFWHADGKTLYFMSDGHPGMGNFDLFVTRADSTGTWATPSNLGYPINTSASEGAIAVALDGSTAYFATDANPTAGSDSVEVGGRRSGSTDLYQFTLPQNARAARATYLQATVVNADTGLPVAAVAELSDAATDKPFLRRRASADDGKFLAVLPAGVTYALAVEEPGYAFYSDRFVLDAATDALEPYALEIRLQPLPIPDSTGTAAPVLASGEPIVLRNVLFATASAELLPSSETELQRLSALLSTNPSLRIRIQGHTDNVGDDAANLDLSQRRATAVRDYLASSGIDASRLEAVGYGEAQPVVDNNSDGNRALNRRTEFVVL